MFHKFVFSASSPEKDPSRIQHYVRAKQWCTEICLNTSISFYIHESLTLLDINVAFSMRTEDMAYSFPRWHENLNQRGSAVKCEGLWKNKTKSKFIEINS